MKKLTTTLLAIAILALSFALIGCSNGGDFTAKAYSSGKRKIESVTIDVIDREIAVSASEDNQIHIDYSESEKEYYDISVSESNELTMKYMENKEITDFIGTKPAKENRNITLKLPKALIANLTITTTNEDIKLSKISAAGSVSLSSSGGNIVLEELNAGKEITLTAKNGNITGTIIGSYDVFSIACVIKKGDCNLPLSKPEGEKGLKINNNNGNIKIDFIKK